MAPPPGRLADRGDNGGGLQPVERRLQPVVAQAGIAAADEGEDLIGCGDHQARRAQAMVARVDNLTGGPDQNVGIPDRGHTVLGRGFDPDRHFAHAEIDRRHAADFGEREERPGHQVLCVAGGDIAGARPEEFELLVVVWTALGHGGDQRVVSALTRACAGRFRGRRRCGQRSAPAPP